MKFRKIFLVVSVLFVFSFSMAAPAKAQLETNPLCWKLADCVAERKSNGIGEKEAAGGWVQNETPCVGSDWGKCLAGNVTKTEISFGGSAQFTDIGVYIKTVYNYAMVVIGIIAVVVLIIAGAQWITSAGNSTTIAAAKKRIGGVIIGLFIAYMSYNILNTINPATINLRLPQVWLLRSIPLGEPPCMEQNAVDDNAVLQMNALFFETYKKLKSDTTLPATHSAKKIETWCGVVYDLPNGGKCKGASCQGWEDSGASNPGGVKPKCGPNHPCSCYFDATTQLSFCKGANLGGVINMNGTKSIEDWYVDYLRLYVLCKYSKGADITYIVYGGKTENPDEDNKEYGFSITSPENGCSDIYRNDLGTSELLGYLIAVEVNDAKTDGTIDDNWLIGKNSCGKAGKPIAGVRSNFFVGDSNGVDSEFVGKIISSNALWTAAEMKGANTCDLVTDVPPYNAGLSDSNFQKNKFFFYP